MPDNPAKDFALWTIAASAPAFAAAQDATPTGPVSVPGVTAPAGQATTGEAAPLGDPNAPAQPVPTGGFPVWMWLPLIGLMVFMIWSSSAAQRKEKKKKEELLSSLTKQDKVQTIGGVIGTIVELHDDAIVLRVDDTSNTRIKFAKSAVQQVITPSPARKDVLSEPTLEAKPEPATV